MNTNSLIQYAWKAGIDTLGEELSKGKFIARKFQEYIAQCIVGAVMRGGKRIVVSVPPQHGKSELCSHYLPVWYLERYPDKNVISASYEYNNASKWGRRVRNTIDVNKGKLSVSLSKDSKARGRWKTSQEGGMLCAGACGPMTGNPGDLIIIDDPHKDWKESRSEQKRADIIDWFNTVVYTRQQPDTTIIVIQTRWHERDLAGYLINEHDDDWEEIRLPALAEANDPLGRKEGEALCPEIFDEKKLLSIKNSLGAQMFACLYQQRPGSATGNIYLREYWRRYTALPERFDLVVQSWDTAYEKGKEHSYSCCTTWIKRLNHIFWVALWRDRLEYPQLKRMMLNLNTIWKPHAILLEDKASGKSLRQELRQSTSLPIVEVQPIGDKIARSHSVTPTLATGNVFLPFGESWADDAIEGLAAYPNNEYMDVADTVSQAIAYMTFCAALTASDIKTKEVKLFSKILGAGFSFNGVSMRDF